jgi:ERCC4-type nuclease
LKVIIDTREQTPHLFEVEEKKKNGVKLDGYEIRGLKTGDYSLEGYEDVFVIERKAGIAELFGNLTGKDNRERFLREMDRLKEFRHKYILVETSINKDLLSLSIPQQRFSVPGSKIMRDLIEIEDKYGVKIWFVGDSFKKFARYIFEYVVKVEKDGSGNS